MREYTNSEIQSLINEYIHKDRDAEILRLRLIHGHTYERIAEEVTPSLSARQVHRIVSRGAATLYRYLGAVEKIVDKNTENL